MDRNPAPTMVIDGARVLASGWVGPIASPPFDIDETHLSTNRIAVDLEPEARGRPDRPASKRELPAQTTSFSPEDLHAGLAVRTFNCHRSGVSPNQCPDQCSHNRAKYLRSVDVAFISDARISFLSIT
jgi:hypothetical protein